MMGGGQEPMMMNRGGPMYRNMGGPMYAQEGMSFGDQLQQGARDNLPFYEMIAEEKMPDTDVLKEMIMNSLKNNPILNSESVQSISPMGYNMRGRDPSNRDSELTALSNSDMNYQDALDMLVKQRRN
jgi:hypothetical protein